MKTIKSVEYRGLKISLSSETKEEHTFYWILVNDKRVQFATGENAYNAMDIEFEKVVELVMGE
jgi:hypothetical protein